MRNDRTLNIKMPSKLYRELQDAAERKHISLASMVRIFCVDGLATQGIDIFGGEDIDLVFAALDAAE